MLLQYSVSGEFSHSLRVLGITFLSSPDLGVLVCGERIATASAPRVI